MNDEGKPVAGVGGDPGREDDVFIVSAPGPDESDDFTVPPGWPKVVGIVGMVWGSLGLICGGLGSAWMAVAPRMMQGAAGQMPGGMPPAITTFQADLFALTVAGTVWSVYLIVCGAVCAARKPVARPMTLLWAALAIVLAAISTKVNLDYQAEIAQWVRDHPSADFSKAQQGPGGAIGRLAGLVFGLFFGLAWPVFCMIWFGLIKTKPEQMTGGVEAPAA